MRYGEEKVRARCSPGPLFRIIRTATQARELGVPSVLGTFGDSNVSDLPASLGWWLNLPCQVKLYNSFGYKPSGSGPIKAPVAFNPDMEVEFVFMINREHKTG